MYFIFVKRKNIFSKKKFLLIRVFYYIVNDLYINFMVDFLNIVSFILINKIFLIKFLDYKF